MRQGPTATTVVVGVGGAAAAAPPAPGRAWHPRTGLDIGQRKPEWLRVPVRIGKGYRQLGVDRSTTSGS